MHHDDKIHRLEARLAEMATELQQLRAEKVTPGADQAPTASRRAMLRLTGAAAVGAAATMATRAAPVAAVDGNPVAAGTTTTTTAANRETTALVYTNTLVPQVTAPDTTKVNSNLFVVRDDPNSPFTFNPSASGFPAAVAGYAFRTVANGLYGYTQVAGYGAVAVGAVPGATGVYAQGVKANIELKPGGNAPASRVDSHNQGELVVDTNGDLWACVGAGTPGVWRKLSGPAAAGAFHPMAPTRVYDSRATQPSPGLLTNATPRLVSIKDKRDINTGAVLAADVVPAGATAISCNVTVVNTVGGGFLTVNPGGNVIVSGATVNWSITGQILNNGVIVQLNDQRQVTAIAGGGVGPRTDFVIDVTGYFV